MRLPPLTAPVVLLLLAAPPRIARAQSLEVDDAPGAIAIERMAIDATVDAGVARVEVDQTFRNTTATVREGRYRFLLPEDAVLGAFSMWMDGKEKQGRILDSREARGVYDAIVRSKRDPGLLEQIGWREFRVNVFPIPANGTVRVRLGYAHVVGDEGAMERLEVPLPKEGAVGELRLHASVAAGPAIVAVDCPSHRAATTDEAPRDGCYVVDWSGRGVAPSGPFVVHAITRRREAASDFDVTLLASRPPASGADEAGWFVARIVPRVAARDASAPAIARDLVFVVDVSGSMSGRKIEQARAALLAGLATLRPHDRFDVVAFSGAVDSLGGGRLLDATPANLERASAMARGLDASGATDVDGALTAALASRASERDRFAAIVLLTDGDPTAGITSPDRIVDRWSAGRGASRLFAFGVGDDVKDFLLTRLAREGRGDARYVAEGDDLERPLATLFERVRTPLLIDPTLDVDAGEVTLLQREPRVLPDLFAGRALVVSGRYGGSGRALFRLRGRSDGRDVVVDVPIDFPATTPDRPHVAQLWAKARVSRLVDDLRAGDSGAKSAELVDEIRSLGLRHQLVTPYTSFLVVEDGQRVARGDGAADEERVPATAEPLDRNAVALDDADGGSPIGVGSFGRGSVGHHGSGSSAFFAARRAGGGASVRATRRAAEPASDPLGADLAASLLWVQRHQGADGSWDAHAFGANCSGAPDACDTPGPADHAVETTGLALLAFTGAGETHQGGTFRTSVARGVAWLLAKQQDDGLLVARDAPDAARQHAIAALALAELHAMTADDALLRLPVNRAVAAAVALRAADGAWRRADGSLDLETTAWMALLLRTAAATPLAIGVTELTRTAAAIAPLCDDATGAVALPASGAPLSSDGATAAALLVRLLARTDGEVAPFVAAATRRLTSRSPRPGADSPRHDPVGWHLAAYALALVDGRRSPQLARERAAGGDFVERERQRCAFGSSRPPGAETTRLGRLQSTLLLTLADEAHLRVLPSFVQKH